MSTRKHWRRRSHERAVEKFYGRGVENYAEFHSGYLNFGLWEPGVASYIQAAENLVRKMGELLGLKPGARLLDVACGMGTQDLFLHKNFGPLEIDAMDVTWKHVLHGQRRAREAGVEKSVRFCHGSAVELPFSEGEFAHVMSIEGAEHFNTREKFLREALRVMVPGGVIALADYTLKRPPRNVLEKVVAEAARVLWKVPRVNVVTVEEYRGVLERTGFRNITIQEVGAKTIPGYYFEQCRKEVRDEMARIRGILMGRISLIIDVAVYQAYKMGLVEYVLVRAEK